MDVKIFREKVLPLFTLSIIITFVTSFFGFLFVNILSNIFVFILLAIASIGILILILKKEQENIALLFLFNVLEGFTLTPLLYLANITDAMIVPEAFGITSVVFISFSFYGWVTKKDVISWRGILFTLLIVALALTIAQLFIRNLIFNLAVDALVALLFVAYIVYDTKNILENYPNRRYIPAAIALYLDFINIFVRLVHILIRLKRK